jgi:CHAT domain-containing protein
MPADLTNLLDKSERELRDYVNAIPTDGLQDLFNQMWDAIRRVQLFAGQARNESSSQALSFSRLAMSVASHLKSTDLQAEAHRMMAYVLNANELYEEAILHYMQAILLLEKAGSSQKAARTRLGLIAALFMTGHYQEALEEGERAASWFIRNGDRDGQARLYANLGNLHHRMDRHAEAVEHHERALRIFSQLKNEAALAPCFLNLGDSLTILDRFEEADRNFERAEKLSRKFDQPGIYTQARYNRAYLSFLRGRYSEAIQVFDELREDYNKTGSTRHAALCDLDESEIFLYLNLNSDALRLATRAADAFNRLGMKYEEAKARAFVGIALTHSQRYGDALQVFADAQDIFNNENNRYFVGSLELYRAQVLFAMGRFWEAHALALSARDDFTALNIPSKRALALTLLVRIGLETSESDDAQCHIDELEKLIGETPIPLHLFPCYSIIGKAAEHIGDLAKAQRFYALAADEIELHRAHLHYDKLRVSFFTTRQQVYEALLRLSLRHEDPMLRFVESYNWCERSKSRGLVDLLSQNVNEVQPHGNRSLLQRIHRLHEELNTYSRRAELEPGKSSVLYSTTELQHKKNELAESLKQLSSEDRELASLHKVNIVSVEEIQKVLPDNCAMLEYFVARNEVLAFVISKDQGIVRRHLCTFSKVQELNERLRLQLDKFGLGEDYVRRYEAALKEATARCLQALYSELIQPLEDVLHSEHLIIVPHDVLHYLPFHAFYDGKQHLIDRFTISYSPSASVFRYCAERKPVEGASPIIVGVPDEKAPLIAEEIAHLKKALPDVRSYYGRRATRKAIRRVVAESSFLHIATHAVFRTDNPMSSSLKLADGSLTALDLYSMTCRTNLVTLSGCNSGMAGLAGADELLGLMRGFLYAGARSLMLSLWPVSDRSTVAFMNAFYKAWLSGSSKSQALRSAAVTVREADPHPYFWAPFFLVGNI